MSYNNDGFVFSCTQLARRCPGCVRSKRRTSVGIGIAASASLASLLWSFLLLLPKMFRSFHFFRCFLFTFFVSDRPSLRFASKRELYCVCSNCSCVAVSSSMVRTPRKTFRRAVNSSSLVGESSSAVVNLQVGEKFDPNLWFWVLPHPPLRSWCSCCVYRI